MGCNLYDSSQLGNVANVLVNLGGVIFTQLLCWTAVLLVLLGRWNVPRWTLLTVIGVTWSGDVVLQLVQGVLANVPPALPRGPEHTYTDYLAVVWFTRNETAADASELKLGLVIGTVAYSALLLLATRWALKRAQSRSAVTPV
jgi:hypothetical protein